MAKCIVWSACLVLLSVGGCSSSDAGSDGGGGITGSGGDGQSDAKASIIGEIDLSDWGPGPIEVEITPDGKTAVVSVGPAFFDTLPGLVGKPVIPSGGTLLIVDLESAQADEVQTEDVPLGIAISPDGTTAYTANYGTSDARGDSLSIINIAGRRVIEEVNVGNGPEQVALSADGSLGIVNVVSGRGVRVFETADVAGTLSDIVETGFDPSDVSFLDGNDRAVAANSISRDVTLLDTSDPSSPTALNSTLLGTGAPYGVTYVPTRDEILAPAATIDPALPTDLVTFTRDGDTLNPSAPLRLPGENFPLAAAADSEGEFAFVAHIVDHKLSIIELDTGDTRSIEWLTESGPSYVAVQP